MYAKRNNAEDKPRSQTILNRIKKTFDLDIHTKHNSGKNLVLADLRSERVVIRSTNTNSKYYKLPKVDLKNVQILKQENKTIKNFLQNILKDNEEYFKMDNVKFGFKNKKDKILILKENKIESKKKLSISHGKEIQSKKKSSNKVNKEEQKSMSRNMRPAKLVYDSLSDDEIDEENIQHFFISPDCRFKLIWDNLILCLTVYSVTICPLELSFFTITYLLLTMDLIIEFIYIIDLILNFFMGFHTFDEILISDLYSISTNYFTTWFVYDLIASFPFNTILNIVELSSENGTISIVPVFRLFRLVKFYKLISLDKFSFHRIKFFDELNLSSTLTRLYKFMFYFIMVSHTLACMWTFIGRIDHPNWIMKCNMDNATDGELFLASFYFVISTIFTIGYGDIICYNLYERSFTIFLLLFGVFVYSFTVSSLSNMIVTADGKTERYFNNMNLLTKFRFKYDISGKLFMKIARFLKYDMSVNKQDKHDLLHSLPLSLRNELLGKMYKDIIENLVFFKGIHNYNYDFIMRVVSSFRPLFGTRNEVLVQQGDFFSEIIFVKRGTLALEVEFVKYEEPNGKVFIKARNTFESELTKTTTGQINEIEHLRVKVIEIRKNEHFGDVLMFWDKRSPLSLKIKTKFAEMFVFRKYELIKISADFPEILKQIFLKSSFNWEQIKRKITKIKISLNEKFKTKLNGNSLLSSHFNNCNKFIVKNKSMRLKTSNCSNSSSFILSDKKDQNIIYEAPSENESEKNEYDKYDINLPFPFCEKSNANNSIKISSCNSFTIESIYKNKLISKLQKSSRRPSYFYPSDSSNKNNQKNNNISTDSSYRRISYRENNRPDDFFKKLKQKKVLRRSSNTFAATHPTNNTIKMTHSLRTTKSKSFIEHKNFFNKISSNFQQSYLNVSKPQQFYSEFFSEQILKMADKTMSKLNTIFNDVKKIK